MTKKYMVDLSETDKETLNDLITGGKERVRKVTHAHVLLKASEGWADQEISRALRISVATIERMRQRFVEEGLEKALTPRRTRRKYLHLLDGSQEAHLIALVCGQPPVGYRRWSLRLLASQMVKLEYADEISHETVRQVMAENELKPWLKEEWCIPPQHNAEFAYHMEDVFEFTIARQTPDFPWSVSMKPLYSWSVRHARRSPWNQASQNVTITNTIEKVAPICSCSLPHCKTGVM